MVVLSPERIRHETHLDTQLLAKRRPDNIFLTKPFRETVYPESLFKEWMNLAERYRPRTMESIEREYGLDMLMSRNGADNAVGILGIINVLIDRNIDTIIVMDKSGRPLDRLTRGVWHQLLNADPDNPGQLLANTDPRYYPFPQVRFMDIGQFDNGDGTITRTEIDDAAIVL